MFHRSYPIRLAVDVSQERIDTLRAVLEAATVFIPGFLVSRLDVVDTGAKGETGANGEVDAPDLIWVNAFRDVDAFWLYGAHPYHTNVINDFLSFESPNTVIGKRSTPATWSDDGDPDAAATGTPGVPHDLSPADDALVRAGVEVPAAYFVEQINATPDGMDAYLQAVRDIYLPMATEHGMHLMASFRSPPHTGEDHLLFIWRVDGWGGAFRSFVGMLNETEELPRWLDAARPLRTGGWRRYLLPTGLPAEWGP